MLTTTEEQSCLSSLVDAWEEFLGFEDKHPDDIAEFRHHINALQCLIAWRVARRVDPHSFGFKVGEDELIDGGSVTAQDSAPI